MQILKRKENWHHPVTFANVEAICTKGLVIEIAHCLPVGVQSIFDDSDGEGYRLKEQQQ
jgi:hypothetical protein